MFLPGSYRYLNRLNVPTSAAERLRLEKLLALARFGFVALTIVAVRVDATEPSQYSQLVNTLLIAWTIFNLGGMAWLKYHGIRSNRTPVILHITDLVWPAIITFFTHGPSSAFFPLFAMAQIGAAFRWGFHETILTSVAWASIVEIQGMLLTATTKAPHELMSGEFELNRLIIRSVYILAAGFLIGSLGENEKEHRAERGVVLRVLRGARAESGMAGSLQAVFEEFSRIFNAARAFIVTQDKNTGQTFLWRSSPIDKREIDPYVTLEPDAEELLGRPWPNTFFVRKNANGETSLARLEATSVREFNFATLPSLPFFTGTVHSVLSSCMELGHEWTVRLVLVNAKLGTRHEQELRFVEELFQQAMAAVYSVYLVRRLRARVGAMERARVARELHDGAIQSLISAEMRVDVLRRSAENSGSPMSTELGRVQELLRREVLNLRELMQQMRPVDLGPQQLIDFMADTVERFRRDTGITARFVSSVQDVTLTPFACRELIRILQEALVNVHKHSEASSVLVTFIYEDDRWRMVVEDNGKGIDFNGRLEGDSLLTTTKGPRIIKERIHNIGAALCIESQPGSGTRLEITVNKKGRFSHGKQEQQSAHSDR